MINVDSPQLNTVARHLGEQPVIDFLILELTELCGFFNVKYAMNDDQIITTAELILQEYPLYNLNDVRLFFRKIKVGDFGDVMHALDGGIILGWLKRYESERTEKIVEVNSRKESQIDEAFKNDDKPFVPISTAYLHINKMTDAGKYDFAKHQKTVELTGEFQKIRSKQGKASGGKIEWEGKQMGMIEFIEYELNKQ